MDDRRDLDLELDLVDLYYYLKKKLIWIVLAAVLGGMLGYQHSYTTAKPMYTATTTVYLLSRASDVDVMYSDFQISNQLVKDFKLLVKGRSVAEAVTKELNLLMSPETLISRISIESVTDSRVVYIKVTDTSAQRAAQIANSVSRIGAETIREIMALDAVTVVDEAKVPTAPIPVDHQQAALLWGGMGALAMMLLFLIIRAADDTIRSEEDVSHYLGMNTLGVIPDAKSTEAWLKKEKKRSKKRRK